MLNLKRVLFKVKKEKVDVIFEDVSTKATKIIFHTKPSLQSVTSGKQLIIYYIATEVRGKYVSAVFSFWDNDFIDPKTKLPFLLNQFMKLKK